MELTLINPSSVACLSKTSRYCKPKFQNAVNVPTVRSLCHLISHEQRRKRCLESSALPETATSVVVAAVAVGAAATLLARRTRASEPVDSSLKICEDCGGSGICSECKGEGFILKKLTEESADKARMSAKNMATRYTAAYARDSCSVLLRINPCY